MASSTNPVDERQSGSLISASSLIGPATLLTILGLVLPVLLLLRYSFNLYDPQLFMIETFALDNYVKVLHRRLLPQACLLHDDLGGDALRSSA
ncbi:MAG: hypothetical protein R3C97_03805 [Geminicoccaceae bacterium]